jgi:hypothetical protein
MKETLAVTQKISTLRNRFTEWLSLFTFMKMGLVDEKTKLKLSALRNQGQMEQVRQNSKMDLRINKNAEYWQKTDVTGKLAKFQADITNQEWKEIHELRQTWTDTYSTYDFLQLMKEAPDNILCLGISVSRNLDKMDHPTQALKLHQVTNTLISFESFIQAMTFAQNNQIDYIQGGNINFLFYEIHHILIY